ncbi:MAG TPA: ABC transporter ATP-binding protein [Clostridiaceae bacterium]|nr:ABC transporter ATP-binding protein [Clostridiaceae bacterium]
MPGKDTIFNLMKYAFPYWHLFLLSLLLILAISASNLMRPYLIKVAIDDYIHKAAEGTVSVEAAKNGVKTISIFFGILVIFEFVFSFAQTYILHTAGNKIILKMREKIFSHIQKLPITFFDKNTVGRIVTRVINDVDAINEMYTNVLISFIQDIFIMAGIVFAMFKMNKKLTLISLTLVPVMAVVTIKFRKKAREIFDVIRTKLALINAFLSEHISGMKIIQVFNMQEITQKEFEDINKEYYVANDRQVMLFGIFRPAIDFITSFILAVLLWYGGRNILKGQLEIGTLYAFINYINRFFQPIMDLTDQINTLQSSLVSSERIERLLEEKPESEPGINFEGNINFMDSQNFEENKKKEYKFNTNKASGMIEFKNVWFAYSGEDWVLKDISFKIEPGETVAFVGATGAGKTSIINLLCGFYENQKGEILIDGINIKNLRKKELRKNIGLVLQDVFLFSGDIKTNIGLFDNEVSFSRIKKSAEYLGADDFINKLPEGYDSPVNERGTTLSSGQRQLLSFARALARDPAILLMDEATSNIDTESEILIQESLSKLMEGRTNIAIAHRLSTIQKADKIFVIHKGEIRESGTHQELLDKEGIYYNLYKLQYQT